MEYLPSHDNAGTNGHGGLPYPTGYVSGPPEYPSRFAGYAEAPAEDPEGGGLIEYWRILRRNRGTLLLVACLGVIVAILVTLPQTPIYRARTALEIQSINNDFLNARQVSPVSESQDNGANGLTDVQTQMKIIQGEHLMDQVIDRYKAANKLAPLQSVGVLGSLKKMANIAPTRPEDADYSIRQRAMKNLTVRQSGQTRLVEVFFDSADPAFAASFLNDLAAAYVDSNIDARWQMSQHTSDWLTRQLDDMRAKLERSEDALEAYARQSGLLYMAPPNGTNGSGEKTNVSEEKLRQLQEELSHAQGDRASAESRFETAKAAPPDALPDVLNDPSLRELQTKITDLRREEADLIAVYTEKHEKVRRVQAQIAPLETAFAKGRAAILDRIRNEYDTALSREALLRADYDSQAGIVSQQSEKSIQYNILKREVDSNQQLYESMLQQVKEASVAAAIRASNIRVVDPAKVPHKPYSPDYWLNSGLGLLAGLLIGISFIVMRERADTTIQQPGDVQQFTGVAELGVIPSAAVETTRRIFKASRKSIGAPLPVAENPGDPPAWEQQEAFDSANGRHGATMLRHTVELMSWNNAPSMVAEAFHATLTSIMFSGENGSRPRLLVFTSGSPREGKTTVVSNLAIALAASRQRVLIIDADMRKPRMHDLFNVPNEQGLSSLLTEDSLGNESAGAALSGALRGLIMETSIPCLSVLPSGPATYAAGNLLYSPVLPELFARAKAEFDMILVDTPPMLSMSDARIAGRLADAVVFVARAGQTTREAVIAAHQRFAEDGTRMLGTILNGWDPRRSPGGYYGYHHGSYYGGKKYSGYHGYYSQN
jgi:capsular exopolysaccharide synthesis family protein